MSRTICKTQTFCGKLNSRGFLPKIVLQKLIAHVWMYGDNFFNIMQPVRSIMRALLATAYFGKPFDFDCPLDVLRTKTKR